MSTTETGITDGVNNATEAHAMVTATFDLQVQNCLSGTPEIIGCGKVVCSRWDLKGHKASLG